MVDIENEIKVSEPTKIGVWLGIPVCLLCGVAASLGRRTAVALIIHTHQNY
jgi:hypothetical protein